MNSYSFHSNFSSLVLIFIGTNYIANPGYYDITWKPSSLSSGIYLINIKTDESDLTHKVMFIK